MITPAHSNQAPDVSVVVCVYNASKFIETCLNSLAGSTWHDFELVLVNDGSTDPVESIIQNWVRSNSHIAATLVTNERNMGIAGARNVGIENARGNIVLFTDADCRVDPEWISEMRRALTDPEVDAASGFVSNPTPANLAEHAYTGRSLLGQPGQSRQLIGCNMGFTAELLSEFKFDPAMRQYADEDELAARLIRADRNRFAFVSTAIVNHEHRLNLKSYLRMGYRQGIGAARLWSRTGQYVGRDMLAGLLCILAIPFALLAQRGWTVVLIMGLLQLAAIAFNDAVIKRKGLSAVVLLPVNTLFYMCKYMGYLRTMALIVIGSRHESRRR